MTSMTGSLPQNPFPFDVECLLDTKYTDEKVRMLDIIVEIFYSQKIQVLVQTHPNPQLLQQMVAQDPKNVTRHILATAHEVLNKIKGLPEGWILVDIILSKSQNPNCKFFALNLLEECINKRWRVPDLPRDSIKNYVTDLVIRISSNEQTAEQERHFLTKLNETLVQIVKKEWPHNWPNFIQDICGASRHSQFLCENNMKILAQLSEDIFDFGDRNMVFA